MNIRRKNWQLVDNKTFDIAIIGGGVNGASIYRHLSRQGYRVILIDRGDFSCGTSQASAMMVWGGLLYLKNLDFPAVYHFSRDRDAMIKSFSDLVRPRYFRYIPNRAWGRNKYYVYLALQIYWLLGKCRRERPTFQRRFEEETLIKPEGTGDSLLYQEGFLLKSDSRFVLEWIIEHQSEHSLALNYCSLLNTAYNGKDKLWNLDLRDSIAGVETKVKAAMVLNCAGVWTDTVNEQFHIRSPYKHVFSKGVFIGYRRPEHHRLPLIFEMGENGDTLTLIPWGPVSLWGPTETMEYSIDRGFSAAPEDIRFLQRHAARNLRPAVAESRIVSLRCGLRPLAVKRNFSANCYPLDISRHHKIIADPDLPWISVYGGKISGCLSMAAETGRKIAVKIGPPKMAPPPPNSLTDRIPRTTFPGLRDLVPTLEWCVDNEFCCTLEDYLRRRTNIAQWVAREGLGFADENLAYLEDLAKRLPTTDGRNHQDYLREYKDNVRQRFDVLQKEIR